MSYIGRDFSPAQQTEDREYTIDFVNTLKEGEELVGATWELIVRRGTDPDPASHLIGDPTLVTPEGTTLTTATTQRIAGVLPDVLYTVNVTVTTNANNTVSDFTHLEGTPVE